MKRKLLALSVILLCLGWGFTMTVSAQDTPEIKVELEKARKLAGDDTYLLVTECVQCRELGPNGEPPSIHSNGEDPNAEPTKVFDNVYYVGSTRVGGWIITTSDGYILLDAMFANSPEKAIIPGMKKLGLDPAKIKYVLITHPGPDHVGGAKYFQDNYGSRIIMTANDWDRVQQLSKLKAENLSGPFKGWAGSPKRDLVAVDGQKLTVGDTTITMVFTPRTANGGGLSYIIPVKDNGEPHMWATYGNSGIPDSIEDKMLYRESLKHLLTYMDAAKVDVMMSSHVFVDGSLERMAELRNCKPGEANPFVIGREDARRYINLFDQCCAVLTARQKAGLDESGRGPLKASQRPPRP